VKRGVVVPLTDDQVVARALYLAGKRPLSTLDEYVRRDALELRAWGYEQADTSPVFCPDLYYLLQEHNGGKDPTAPDPADRWSKPGATFQNRTVDCSGGNAWMHGFDRYQPKRMATAVGYDGWWNTDSKIIDARRTVIDGSQPRCFEDVERPEPGAIITCRSGSHGHRVGHEGCVIAVHCLEWDAQSRECWDLVDVVDCAQRSPNKTNKQTTARGWFGTGAMFLRSVMTP
jgi:hypothetical protein